MKIKVECFIKPAEAGYKELEKYVVTMLKHGAGFEINNE
jgi:hypothetical protein